MSKSRNGFLLLDAMISLSIWTSLIVFSSHFILTLSSHIYQINSQIQHLETLKQIELFIRSDTHYAVDVHRVSDRSFSVEFPHHKTVIYRFTPPFLYRKSGRGAYKKIHHEPLLKTMSYTRVPRLITFQLSTTNELTHQFAVGTL